ncbi:hypothetical protein [Halosimplex pelagicum]|uniref:DUF3899 domain-containing protein n=1 Tax=Halosimplex pelagicum TaxID=869886 RepID=A0A7D5TFI7_9EURY|nr:hypothetical protein [Halosimplex pelagicum]QLH80416.1 hypothetical protein HZS54_01680 [Halosimplex pelagicum]
MDERAPIYAAAAGVIAPVATVRLVGGAVDAGVLHPIVGLVVVFLVPVLGIVWVVSAAWKLGLTGWDPLDRFRSRATVREDIPAQFHDAIDHETLDAEKEEGKIPTNLFVYGLVYLVGVPVFAVVFIL